MNFILRRRGLGATSCSAIKALSTTGIEAVRNDGAIPEGDLVFRWGCTSNVKAKTIINQAKAIHVVSDKRGFRMLLDPKGLCPKTWVVLDEVSFPCVVRPQVHHQGRHLYVCHNRPELLKAWRTVGGNGYISEFIDKTAEYRVFVVNGRVPCVASKAPNKDGGVAWNVSQGGKFENVRWGDWPLMAIEVAIKAFKLSGLDFGGVDVMVDKAGKAYVLEINSACSLTSPYRQSCFTRCFDWIVQNGHEWMEPDPKMMGYGRFIHPCMD